MARRALFVAILGSLLCLSSVAWAGWTSQNLPSTMCAYGGMAPGWFADQCSNSTAGGPDYADINGTWSEWDTGDWLSIREDANGFTWGVEHNANCAATAGYVYYWDGYSGWVQLDSSNPECVVDVGIGNACVTGGGTGCNDDEIYVIRDDYTHIDRWNPSTSSWNQSFLTYPGSNSAIRIAAVPNTQITECDGSEVWVYDNAGNVYMSDSVKRYVGIWICARNGLVQNTLPSGCLYNGASLVDDMTTGYIICDLDDLYQWNFSNASWTAMGVGDCPNDYGAYGDGYVHLGAYSPTGVVWCWSPGGNGYQPQMYSFQP